MNHWEKNEIRFFRVLLIIALALVAVCVVAAATIGILALTVPEAPAEDPAGQEDQSTPSGNAPTDDSPAGTASRLLGQTVDMGQSYIDSMIFVGESTTAHLRSRGVLSGGKSTKQVWSDSANTMTLDLNILQKTINYPETGQAMTIPAAAGLSNPKYIVLSFGVNGIQGFAKNENLYKTAYGKLIGAIHQASPETIVILQTVYPVAANQMTFGEGAATINGYIRRLNELLPEIAAANDAYVVDTASVLTNAEGMLRAEYQTGDGLHLTETAYVQILNYLRTHGYTK